MRTHWRVIRNDLHGILPPCWVSSAHIVLAVRQRRRALLTFVRAGFVTIRAKLTASALALALIGATYPAMAGGLGRMHVQSALGQPFRAEIDITGVRSQELSQIRVNIASPAAFAEMQMDYPEVLQGVSVNVVRKPDGKMVAGETMLTRIWLSSCERTPVMSISARNGCPSADCTCMRPSPPAMAG
jgi:hypothetical protein